MKRPPLSIFGSGALLCAGLLAPRQALAGALESAASPGAVPAQTLSVPGANESAPVLGTADPAFSASPILDGRAPIPERLAAVARLGQNLSRERISVLYAFLKGLPGPQETNRAALTLLKNNLVSVLQDQTQPPAGLTTTLIGIYRDPAQDPVARDYALQHLVTWAEQGAADAPDAGARIQAILRQAAQENTSTAGTALLGLHRLDTRQRRIVPDAQGGLLHGAGIPFESEEISRMAFRMLASTNLPCASRITAVQVCAEGEVTQALPAIQALAQAKGTSTALRISAIAALGWLGGPEQAALLGQLEAEQNLALEPAIEGALRRLQTKLLKNPALTQNAL